MANRTNLLAPFGVRGLWAQDLDAVMRELHLERPVLCGWSYGSLVILDYIRQYGEERDGRNLLHRHVNPTWH